VVAPVLSECDRCMSVFDTHARIFEMTEIVKHKIVSNNRWLPSLFRVPTAIIPSSVLSVVFTVGQSGMLRLCNALYSCLLSSNRLVRSISRHRVVFSKYNSLLGSNALVCCSRYGWSRDSFLSNCIPLNNFFEQWCLDNLTESEITLYVNYWT